MLETSTHRTRISRGRPQNRQLLLRIRRPLCIASFQKVFKEIAQELQGDIFERQCWSVEQLEEIAGR